MIDYIESKDGNIRFTRDNGAFQRAADVFGNETWVPAEPSVALTKAFNAMLFGEFALSPDAKAFAERCAEARQRFASITEREPAILTGKH